MIELKEEYEQKLDSCGNTTIAALSINNMEIPLCEKCVLELTEEINKFNNTIHCHQCSKFIMSSSGWNYGGSCTKLANDNGDTIDKSNAGYSYCKDCMDTCEHATKGESEQ